MKKLRKIIFVILFVLIVLGFSREAFAIDNEENTDNYSSLYKEYLNLSDEEKSNLSVIPRKYDVSMDVLDKKQTENKLRSSFTNIFRLSQAPETQTLPSSFILLKDENTDIECEQYGGIDIQVENQGSRDGLCWAFASTTALETNFSIKGKDYDFSERHADYFTSKEFGGERELRKGGTFDNFIQYCTYGYGPVLEQDVPYDSFYEQDEYEDLLDLQPQVYVYKTIDYPAIYKDGSKTYSEEEINEFRNNIKSHIMNNGGLYATICSAENEDGGFIGTTIIRDYNGKSVLNYNGNHYLNHAITIIGWDDNFSIENFPEDIRPKNNGAYIALNSWGEQFGDNGIFYISYEDKLVEADMSGFIDVQDEIINDKVLNFEDQNLYNAIKPYFKDKMVEFDDENNKIYCRENSILSLKNIDLRNNNISSIKGIEQLINLETLNLSNNSITDINELQNLINLRELNLNNNNITNIEGLNYLTNLNTLKLSNNDISNIESLNILTNLSVLDLSDNNIIDISSLPNTYFGFISLSNNPINNFGNNSIECREIYFDNCNIDDEKLYKLYTIIPSYRVLSIRNNNITDLSCFEYDYWEQNSIDASDNKNLNLSKMPKAAMLVLKNCNINNVYEIAQNFKGYSIDLSNNPIKDISPFSETNISGINIGYTDVKDISSLTRIIRLGISGLTDVQGLEVIRNLKSLEMDNCDLDDNLLQEIVQKNTQLENLSINDNNITKLECLENYNTLVKLSANNNHISDVMSLSNLWKINTLDLSNNEINDISSIKMLLLRGNLNSLNISENKIVNIDFDLINDKRINAERQKLNGTIIDIEKDRKTQIELPSLFYKNFINGMYKQNSAIICKNCTINSVQNKLIIKSDILEEGKAEVKVVGGMFDGSTYSIDYNTVEKINVTDIRIKKEPKRKYYLENENFDDTDLSVEVMYENGTTEKTTEYTLLNTKNLVAGQENIIIKSNKNPEIQTTQTIKVYGSSEIEEIQFEDINLYNDIKSKRPFGDYARDIKIMKYDDNNKVLFVPKEDIDIITIIDDISREVSNISGLEKFSKLQDINLQYNSNITSVDNLLVLENLSRISLNVEKIDSIESLLRKESVKRIIIRAGDEEVHKTDSDIIELPRYIYESVRLQDNVTIDASIHYRNSNNNGTKKVEVTFDDEREVATVKLDKEITEEFGEGDREITVEIIGGKTDGSTYQFVYHAELEDSGVINNESKYYIDEAEILGISPETGINQFINNFNKKYEIVITNKDAEVNEGIIGTGMEIQILENNEEKAKYTVIVTGDTTGDGIADIKDILAMNKHRLNKSSLEDEFFKAGDINKDGIIDIKDILQLNKYRLGKTNSI